MNEWLQHNTRIGARVGMRLRDGRVVTPHMLANEPLFSNQAEPDENTINLITLTANTNIQDRMHMATNEIAATTEKMETAATILANTTRKMASESDHLAGKLKQSASQVKDYAERLNVSLGKFGALVDSAKLREQVEQVERLVGAMERLAALQDSGKLDRVLAAVK